MTDSGGLGRRIGKAVYVAALMAALGYGAYCWYGINLMFWSRMVQAPVCQILEVVASSALLVVVLDRIDSGLRGPAGTWREWSLFRRNINFVPMDYAFLRAPFLALLYFNLPILAWIEEKMFRDDMLIYPTSGWHDALWRSALFGAAHVLAGAKIRTSLPLTLGGLWFSWQFMGGGVETSTLAHLAMNTAGLTIMLWSWARTGENPFTE